MRRLNPVFHWDDRPPTEATLSGGVPSAFPELRLFGHHRPRVLSRTLEMPTSREMSFRQDDGPLLHVPPHRKMVHASALDAALRGGPALKDVTFHKNGKEDPSLLMSCVI